MELIAGLFVLAILVERFVEYVFSGYAWAQRYLHLIALAFACFLCVSYQADILSEMGLISVFPVMGQLLTGLIIAGGANYLNDFIASLKR